MKSRVGIRSGDRQPVCLRHPPYVGQGQVSAGTGNAGDLAVVQQAANAILANLDGYMYAVRFLK